MKNLHKILKTSITVFTTTVMLFSCSNNTREVRDFLASKNLPIGVAKNAFHVYKDSGRITSKLITPLLRDFSNRKEHPYNEFPDGLKIVSFEGQDSVTVTSNYALSYSKTDISELIGNVVVLNHSENSKLETEQLYWDQKTNYFFSEKRFTLSTLKDTVHGVGFECKEDLSQHLAKKTIGRLETAEEQ